MLLLRIFSPERPGGWRAGGAIGFLLNSLDVHFSCLSGLVASAPGPGEDELDKRVEIVGAAPREVSKYPLVATTIALKIAL